MRGWFLVALLLASGTVQASDWVSLGKWGDRNAEILIDESSIRGAGEIRRAWFKVAFPSHIGSESARQKWETFLLIRIAFNCSEKTSLDEVQKLYYSDGAMVARPAESFSDRWYPVAPGTLGNKEMQFICAWKPK